MARFVKVFQIQRVVYDLVEGMCSELSLASLELENKNHRPNQEHGIDSPAHARYGILKINGTLIRGQGQPKDLNFFKPGIPLGLFQGKIIGRRKLPIISSRVLSKKSDIESE